MTSNTASDKFHEKVSGYTEACLDIMPDDLKK